MKYTLSFIVFFVLLSIGNGFSVTPINKAAFLSQEDQGCGGNCLTQQCSSCVCGEKQYYPTLATMCNQTFWSSSCCQCIVRLASRGNANAVSESHGEIRVGLFQISSFDWAVCSKGKAPCDPAVNFECTKIKYKQYQNKWSGYWPEYAKKCGCS